MNILIYIWGCHFWWGDEKGGFQLYKSEDLEKITRVERKTFVIACRVLLKAVVRVIPTYIMSCFKLPLGLIHAIKGLIRKFGWG